MRAAVGVLLLGFLAASTGMLLAAFPPDRPARAETTGSVAIACEFLVDAIDGDIDDVPNPIADLADACDGLDAADVAAIAGDLTRNGVPNEFFEHGIGDSDGVLEATDFIDIDLDANQITDGGTGVSDEIYLIAFVDDEAQVTFDAESGVTVVINDDGQSFGGPDDANAETCEADDDLDCDGSTPASVDGDGVVVATIADGTASDDASLDVDVLQADDVTEVSTQTIYVQGLADEVWLSLVQTTIATSADALACAAEADAFDAAQQVHDLDKTVALAMVTDPDGDALTRQVVGFEALSPAIALIDDDGGEPASEPRATTGLSIDAGISGVGALAVICGGEAPGVATIIARINEGTTGEEDAVAGLTVSDEPLLIGLTAAPAAIECNGMNSSTVTATVADLNGAPVPDGTNVNLSVVALGSANPVNAPTVAGIASSEITPVAGAMGGVTVIVTAGAAQVSIGIDCLSTVSDLVRDAFDIAGGAPYGGPYSHQQVTAGYSLEPLELPACGAGTATAWYRFEAHASPQLSAQITVDTFGSDYDTVLAVYEGWPIPPPSVAPIACNDDAGGAQSAVTFYAHAANIYYIQIGGKGGATGTLQFNADVRIDQDRDGCTDHHEWGFNPVFGGDRSPADLWDFYDATWDQRIDLADTLTILSMFGTLPGDPSYDPLLDRVAPDPFKPYRTAYDLSGNGIDLDDALVSLASFGHDCTGAP